MNDSINPPPAGFARVRRKRYSVLAAAIMAAAAAGSVIVSRHSNAQDDAAPLLDPRKLTPVEVEVESHTVQVPKVMTHFREERVGDGVRRVPVQTVVVEQQVVEHPVRIGGRSQYTYRTVGPGLPHADEVGPLVEQILRRRSTKESLSTEDTATPSKLDGQLRDVLGAQFDAMHDQQAEEMETLEKRLQTLRKQHAARAEARDGIIARRMNELLRQPDPLAWDPSAKPLPGPAVNGRSVWFSKPATGSTRAIVVPNSGQFSAARKLRGAPQAGFDPSIGNGPHGDAFRPKSPESPRQPDVSSRGVINPGVFQMQLRSTQISDDRAKELANEIYSAIGRVSTDRNDANLKQLNEAVMKAERAIAESKRRAASERATIRRAEEAEVELEEMRDAVEAAVKMAGRRASERAADHLLRVREKASESRQRTAEAAADTAVAADVDVEVLIEEKRERRNEEDSRPNDRDENVKEAIEEQVELRRSR